MDYMLVHMDHSLVTDRRRLTIIFDCSSVG